MRLGRGGANWTIPSAGQTQGGSQEWGGQEKEKIQEAEKPRLARGETRSWDVTGSWRSDQEERDERGEPCREWGDGGGGGRAQPKRHQRAQVPPGLTWEVLSAGFFITAWRKLLST